MDGSDDDEHSVVNRKYMGLSQKMCRKLMCILWQQQNEIHPFIIYRTLLNPIKVVAP